MKNLTTKFRNQFQNYDYTNPDIDILLTLVETILDIIQLISIDDCDNARKLASFVKLISQKPEVNSFLDHTDVIEYVYECEILPVLVDLDNKYETIVTKEETLLDRFNTDLKKLECENNGEYTDSEIQSIKIIEENKKLFDTLKYSVNRLSVIIEYIVNGRMDISILRELCEINNSSNLSQCHNNKSIRKLSSALNIMTDFLITVVKNKDYALIKNVREEMYNSIDDIKKFKYE